MEKVATEIRAWLEGLRLALGARTGSIWLLDRDGWLKVRLQTPPGARIEPAAAPLDGHALGWVVSEGVALRAPREDIFHEVDAGWLVAAPLSDSLTGRVGCVVLDFEGVPRQDAARALDLAASLAGRLLSEIRASERAVIDLARYEALYRAVQDVERELDLKGLADSVCRRALQVSGARGAVVASWDPGTDRGRIVATSGEEVRGLSDARLDGGSSFLGLALRNATELPRDDLTARSRLPLYVRGIDTRAGSAIIVPMNIEGQPVGAITVEYDLPRRFAEKDVERLKALAAVSASAFRNALEYGAVKALSLTDSLTGLPNRRATERALASAVAVAERTGGSFAVAIADVDHFKRFNDQYGHDAGDLALRTVARVIRDELRPGDHAGRWGGEEFLIVLPSTDAQDAVRVIERVRHCVELTRLRFEGTAVSLTLSAGVSAYPSPARGAAAAVKLADAALYEAKRSGRNGVALASDTPHGRGDESA